MLVAGQLHLNESSCLTANIALHAIDSIMNPIVPEMELTCICSSKISR
jgi:hypothetical protein